MTFSKTVRVLLQTTRMQLLILSKTWAARLSDLLMPSAIALGPIILGRAVAGDEAGLNFAQHTQTTNFAGFLLIGGGTFLGTLEILYLAPASMATILAGVALAFMLYSALIFIGAMVVGALLFQIVFQTNQLSIALAFLVIGLPPIYGLALLYGALVLRLKETDAFIQLAQWVITLLMGVYFPITLFPIVLKMISLLFPPTWLTQGLRSTLLGVPYLSNSWLMDLAVLLFFCVVGPILGYLIFARTENTLRANSGLGEF